MFWHRALFILVALLFLTQPPVLQAQQQGLKSGTRVRIAAPVYFSGLLIGVVANITPDSLTLTHGNSAGLNRLKSGTTRFPLSALTKTQISKGRGSSDATVTSGVVGFFAGLGITVLLSKTTFSGEKELALIIVPPLAVVSSTVMGILINRRERWKTIPSNSIRPSKQK